MTPPLTVWVGYSNGKPHIFHDPRVMREGQRVVAVYASRRAAQQDYEDVRKMMLRPFKKVKR